MHFNKELFSSLQMTVRHDRLVVITGRKTILQVLLPQTANVGGSGSLEVHFNLLAWICQQKCIELGFRIVLLSHLFFYHQ